MDPTVIQNSRMKIAFDEKGSLVEFVDLGTGRNFIEKEGASQRPLFRISCSEFQCDRVLQGTVRLSSRMAGSIISEPIKDGIRITFEHIDGLDLCAVCTIRIDPADGLSHWQIRIDNHTPYAIKMVDFPVIETLSRLSDHPENDRILLPKQDGLILPNPSVMSWEGEWPERKFNQRFSYPGEGREIQDGLSAQMMAYYDDKCGLYIGVHDSDGCPKYIGPIIVRRDSCGDIFDMTVQHRMSETPGNDYDRTYDTVLGVFSGDWQDAADLYKSWATKQSWCLKTVADRSDIPEWVKKSAFFFCMRLRYQKGGKDFLYHVPEYIRSWGAKLRMPMVAMMCGWEKWGEWTGPDYFPPYGEERFAHMCEALKARGDKPFPFGLSGFKLPIRKKMGMDWVQSELEIDYDNRETFDTEYSKVAAIGTNGLPLIDSEVESWDGMHGYACIGTDQAYRQIHDASLRLVRDYGAQICQADQVLDGGTPECYSPFHHHPLGKDSWQSKRLCAIYDETRKDCKAVDDDFILSQEWPGELFIQHLDIYHCRNYDQPRGIAGVPLFSYLYHAYLPSFGGDWVSMLSENTCGVFVHASNFVLGNLPAGCPQNMRIMTKNIEVEDADPDMIKLLQNIGAVSAGLERYLIFGDMQKRPRLAVPDIDVQFCGMEFSEWRKRKLRVPAVLSCLWKSPDGQTAWALANISDTIQRFPVPFPGYDQNDEFQVNIYINGHPPIRQAWNTQNEIELAPLDTAIVEIDLS